MVGSRVVVGSWVVCGSSVIVARIVVGVPMGTNVVTFMGVAGLSGVLQLAQNNTSTKGFP